MLVLREILMARLQFHVPSNQKRKRKIWREEARREDVGATGAKRGTQHALAAKAVKAFIA
jgi:hypothetical protein